MRLFFLSKLPQPTLVQMVFIFIQRISWPYIIYTCFYIVLNFYLMHGITSTYCVFRRKRTFVKNRKIGWTFTGVALDEENWTNDRNTNHDLRVGFLDLSIKCPWLMRNCSFGNCYVCSRATSCRCPSIVRI